MRRSNADGSGVEHPTETAPSRWKRRAAVVALSAAMLIGLPAATAGASTTAATAPNSIHAAAADPECQGQAGRCWEYFSWYWTYESCHATGRQQLANNPGRYDDYNCQGGHGLVVWLWLHRK